jgi:hypothetical protein
MKHKVLWKPDAERQLAAIWNGSTNRNAITESAHVIDEALATKPEEVGESREEGFRILFESPLGVIYKISVVDRRVVVVAVWSFE